MSQDIRQSGQNYEERLSDFESQLRLTLDDNRLQQEVFAAIRDLLKENRGSEADIRRILHERFEAGQLREETLQVVQRMLDRVLSEHVRTVPDADEEPDFGRTDVISPQAIRRDTDPDQLQPGSILRDRFLLQKRVSGGSMGVVFKALDRRLAEVEGVTPWVAIKVLTPKLARNAQALRAIQQEAAKGRCLSHPNIVRFIDLDREDDAYFIVMEWIEGRSLAEILDDPESRDLGPGKVLDIANQLADALEYAHRCGVVHADVKPGNVMLTPEGRVKLIDFGVARIRQQQVAETGAFDPGVLGAATPAYSSMQVLTGEDPVPADDVFSLACLVYRLVAGYRVFGPRNAAEAVEEAMTPQRPAGLGDAQWRALKKALSHARVTRYDSPREFIDAFAEGLPRSPRATEGTGSASGRALRPAPRRWPWAVALVAAAGVAGVGAWQLGYIELPTELMPASMTQRSGAGDAEIPAGSPLPEGDEDAVVSDTVSIPTEQPEPPPAEEINEAGDGLEPIEAFASDDSPVSGNDPDDAPEPAPPEPAVPAAEPADDRLPATHTLTLGGAGSDGLTTLEVVLREDGEAAVIDLVRPGGDSAALEILVEETASSGNPAEVGTRQYRLSNDGQVSMAAGESTTQLRIVMTPDSLREPDAVVNLVVRDAALGQELGRLAVSLEDDDQRSFEDSINPNTVGFAVNQVSVREDQAAAQIDLVRYKPDDGPLEIDFRVQDVTASRDEDYFPPFADSVTFAAGERSARILVPLVQDVEVEADETFFIELTGDQTSRNPDIFRRIAVMIRDDDG